MRFSVDGFASPLFWNYEKVVVTYHPETLGLSVLGDGILPSFATNEASWKDCNIEIIYLGDKITELGDNAFAKCK